MSVTFGCPNAPRQQVPCRFCAESWAEYPEGNGLGGRCDRYCTGFTDESVAPEANFANVSAAGLLRLLGFDCSCASDLYGECDAATMRQRILRARNKDRSALVVDPVEIPGGWAGTQVVNGTDGLPTIQRMGPTIIMGGNTDERTLDRLDALEALALWAQEHDLKITWG